MKLALGGLILLAAGTTACGPSRAQQVFSTPALGEQLSPGIDLVFPARLRANEPLEGRLVVTENSFLFESSLKDDASRRWDFRSIRALRKPNYREVVLEPFEGSGFIFEIVDPGIDDLQYKQILGRL